MPGTEADHNHHGHHHHGHDHGHHHHGAPKDLKPGTARYKMFITGIVLNMAYVVIQAVAGLMTGSMALLADAGHNLSDVATLALSLLALRLSHARPTASFTYGYKKTTILAALVNGVVLFITIGVLAYGSVQRILHPEPVAGGLVAVIAAVGIAVNLGSAFLFFRDKEHDLNSKSAYLHLVADALVSLGVVIAGVVIKYTGWYWLDGATSIVILVVIFFGTWSLLTASLRLTLDAVPENVHLEEIHKAITGVDGVVSMHHLHVWAMSTTENALTVHIVLKEQLSFAEKMERVNTIKHKLRHRHIHHATIELESPAMPCADELC
ncbi:MAG: cation diffusion facilitator family transporter [Bacteroidota bacterium]